MPATPEYKMRLAQISLRNRKKTHSPGERWPLEKKIEVVTQYMLLGSLKVVSAVTGVPYDVVRKWKGQPFWRDLEAEIRSTEHIQMDSKLSKIVEKSLDATLDRVENGDFIYDQKSGEVRRKPAALRDIHRVAVDILAKRELLRGNATERKETTQITVAEQLKVLAAEMARWNNPNKQVVIDASTGEVEDAVYEEREEGLQDGEQEVQQPSGSSGEEGGEESSPEGNDGQGSGS